MIDNSVTYVLCRMEDDSSLTPVSSFASLSAATCAAGYTVESVDHDYAYELHSPNGRVATFAEGRIGYRMWAMKTGRLSPSLDDRLDHDVDELLAS
jgi:hypothetical protein